MSLAAYAFQSRLPRAGPNSELIHSLLPVFLVSVIGASALSVGLVEGMAEATAAIILGIVLWSLPWD